MVRNKWEVYANISQKDAFQLFKKILGEQGIQFDIEKAPPNFMYDAKNDQLILKNHSFSISIIYVSADPITRVFASILGTAKNFNGITFLSIQYNRENRKNLSSVLQEFSRQCYDHPWNITRYPRFRFAILLQGITKLKWKRFLCS